MINDYKIFILFLHDLAYFLVYYRLIVKTYYSKRYNDNLKIIFEQTLKIYVPQMLYIPTGWQAVFTYCTSL